MDNTWKTEMNTHEVSLLWSAMHDLPFRQSIAQWRGNALVNECYDSLYSLIEAISLVQHDLNVEHVRNVE